MIVKDLLGIFGILWSIVWCLLSWILVALLLVARQVEAVGTGAYMIVVIDLKNDAWFASKLVLGKGWGGFAFGNVVYVMDTDTERWKRTVKHESRHVVQTFLFGIIQPILYFLASIFIWIFLRKRHSYYDNPFERDARKAAGQPVEIPKEKWTDGPEDRWAWW
jgi:uncharacterized membrane protein